ncbi:MAG TPA: hypothetical protein VEQ63_05790, partial [Bryobacteraceae bacterium]|nr:hypothetical protein [Bryobacteraceae bacterium]
LAEIFQAAKGVFIQNPVEVFTRYTGGKEFPFVSDRDLDRVLGELSRELHNQYIITYTPSTLAEGGFHKIRVEVARRDVEVRTRDGYWLAAQQ